MSVRAVFLDRDGTLNVDTGYIRTPEEVTLLPHVGDALRKLKAAGYLLIVISNQSGIARGIMTRAAVEQVNYRLNEMLRAEGVEIDDFYFCPAHPEFSAPEDCACRKPSPKMILDAAGTYSVDLSKAYMIGDMPTDIEAGINAGIPAIFLLTGHGSEQLPVVQKKELKVAYIANNLLDAVNFILKDVHE